MCALTSRSICRAMAVDFSPTMLNIRVTSTLSSFGSERRFTASTTIGDFKGKLELITGATAIMMQLQLFDNDGKYLCELDNDDSTLESYPIKDGYRVHVIDKDPTKTKGEFEDTSKVEKYEMSDEAYTKRTDSVQAFKKRMKLGQFAGKDEAATAEAKEKEEKEKKEAEAIPVGSRCEVTVSGAMAKRGTVMFVGKTDFKPGYWVGVKYDEPLGKNDGSVQGKRYFECPPKYGAFVKPKNIQIGDFPEEDFSNDEM